MNKEISKLQLITVEDSPWSLCEQVEKALAAGADWIQLRNKTEPWENLVDDALWIREKTKEANCTFIVNDSLDLMSHVKADGIHIGKKDFPPQVVRNVIGAKKILGVTVNSIEDAKRVVSQGLADYVGVGPFSPTQTKENHSAVLTELEKEEILKILADLPSVMIGGIQPENLSEIKQAGYPGVAVASGILGQQDIAERLLAYQEGWRS